LETGPQSGQALTRNGGSSVELAFVAKDSVFKTAITMKRWKIAGINFDHFHMGDLLRQAANHPDVEIVGISDEQPERMVDATSSLGLRSDQVFTDYRACLEKTRPDVVILCPAAAKHGEWVAKVAPYDVHLLVEKPFAATLAEADTMIAAVAQTGKRLFINWPLAWQRGFMMAKRLIDDGVIGEVLNVHHHGGNRGPLWHGAGKHETTAAEVEAGKPHSWFYKRAHGGGSLQDYLGYGTTLGTWLQGGRVPLEVTAVVDEPPGLEVDEHAIVIARYAHGLSKFETRWGTFTDPWTEQPQPKCGFIIQGTDGTIGAADYENWVTIQTRKAPQIRELPADELQRPMQNPIQYFLHCLAGGEPVRGPVSVEISRIGQQINDAAVASAREKRTVRLDGNSEPAR
jgi:predicted dehydrogenase